MNNKLVFVTLTPKQQFFFGGEQGSTAEYFLKGSFMPQQTALLGFVRHQILIQNKILKDNKIENVDKAVEYIGESSFKWNKNEQKFGKILSLSPCYLAYNDNGVLKKYLPYHQKFVDSIQKVDNHFILPEHDPKIDYPDVWKCITDGTTICNHNNYIYKEIERTGNEKNYSGKKEEKGYFKQIWLSLTSGFSFGFYLSIAEDVDLKNNDVVFGKENSPFLMEVFETQGNEERFADHENANAILFTSDAYVSDNILQQCDFAVTDTLPFRNIVTELRAENNYSKLNDKKSQVRLQLLKRGSILFPNSGNMTNLAETIKSQKNFHNIGYNHIHLLNIPY